MSNFSIHEAAKYLGVSTKTLRRWEASGNLSPIRTTGGHRRYALSDLAEITKKKKIHHRKAYIRKENIVRKPIEVYEPYSLHPEQVKVIKAVYYVFFSFLFLALVFKTGNSLRPNVSQLPIPPIVKSFLGARYMNSSVAIAAGITPSVLAAATSNDIPVFNVNTISSFKDLADFTKGLTSTDVATGTLEATGAATFGSTIDVTGIATLRSDLNVGGNTVITGNGTVVGNLQVGNITKVNGVTYS